MTQTDLPQISLSRYVDLLKRRRWQVIPVSFLGLFIGGLVAFFIPRFYVASAGIAYQQPPGEDAGDPQDPFGAIIDSAKLTLPLAIEQTIKELGWPEGLIEDRFDLGQNCNAINERLSIYEFGNSKGRRYALIRLSYKDRDGDRSAAFLNKLVATWIAQERGKLMDGARLKLGAAKAEHKLQTDAYDKFLQMRQHLQSTYHIEPELPLSVQFERHRVETERNDKDRDNLRAKQKAIAKLRIELEHAQAMLREMPSRVPVDMELLQATAATTPQGAAILAELTYEEAAKEIARSQSKKAQHDHQMAYLTKRLMALVKGPEVGEDGKIDNPARQGQREQIEKLELELKVLEGEVGPLETRIRQEAESLLRQIDGYAQYDDVTGKLEQVRKRVDDASSRVLAAENQVGRLTNEPTVRPEGRATVPPAPTEPNLLLVALLGCVIGLFAATALVLLLDVLQGSFKTVDDVERSLSVPVLGGTSHLETEMQRRTSVRSRRRATLVAAAFLTLVGSVVMLYYFDPTRLPPFVRDMLAIVLGTA